MTMVGSTDPLGDRAGFTALGTTNECIVCASTESAGENSRGRASAVLTRPNFALIIVGADAHDLLPIRKTARDVRELLDERSAMASHYDAPAEPTLWRVPD